MLNVTPQYSVSFSQLDLVPILMFRRFKFCHTSVILGTWLKWMGVLKDFTPLSGLVHFHTESRPNNFMQQLVRRQHKKLRVCMANHFTFNKKNQTLLSPVFICVTDTLNLILGMKNDAATKLTHKWKIFSFCQN